MKEYRINLKKERLDKKSKQKKQFEIYYDVEQKIQRAEKAKSDYYHERMLWEKIVQQVLPDHYLLKDLRNSKVMQTDIVNMFNQSVNQAIALAFGSNQDRVAIEISNDYFSIHNVQNTDENLRMISDACKRAIYDDKNNLSKMYKGIVTDYLAFGNVAINQKYDKIEQCFKYSLISIEDVFIETDIEQNIINIYREYRLNALQIQQYFDDEEIDKIKIASNNTLNWEQTQDSKSFWFLEVYEYNKKFDTWFCTIILKNSNLKQQYVIRMHEYDYQPILYARYNVQPNKSYGESILKSHLANIILYNDTASLLEVAKKRAVLPPMISTTGAFEAPVDFTPDAINSIRDSFIGKAFTIPLVNTANLSSIIPLIQMSPSNIGQALGINTLLDANKDDRGEYVPVTTVQLKERLVKMAFIPILQGIELGIMKPIIEAHLVMILDNIMDDIEVKIKDTNEDTKNNEEIFSYGRMQIPQQLIDFYKKDSKKIKIEYKSGASDLLDDVGLIRQYKALEIVARLANFIPPEKLNDMINALRFVNVAKKATGFPEVFNTDEEIKNIEAERQQQLQIQQQMLAQQQQNQQ